MNRSIVTTYAAIAAITVASLYVISALHISYPVTVTPGRLTDLQVTGEGKVEVIPDVATVDIGITVNRAASVAEAQSHIDTVNNAIIAATRALGIAEKDIRTSNYSISPNYAYDDSTSRIDGYNGFTSVVVRTKNTSQVPDIISEATKAGANQINGVQFTVENPGAFREAARKKAIEDAREQANRLAKELGMKVGKVIDVFESAPTTDTFATYRSAPEAGGGYGGGAPDIQPGSQEIHSIVTVTFERTR